MAAAAAVTFLLGAIIVPSGLAYRDFDVSFANGLKPESAN
jgi:hypothetical protein